MIRRLIYCIYRHKQSCVRTNQEYVVGSLNSSIVHSDTITAPWCHHSGEWGEPEEFVLPWAGDFCQCTFNNIFLHLRFKKLPGAQEYRLGLWAPFALEGLLALFSLHTRPFNQMFAPTRRSSSFTNELRTSRASKGLKISFLSWGPITKR